MRTKNGWQLICFIVFCAGLSMFLGTIVFTIVIVLYVYHMMNAAPSANIIAICALLLASGSGLMSLGFALEHK